VRRSILTSLDTRLHQLTVLVSFCTFHTIAVSLGTKPAGARRPYKSHQRVNCRKTRRP